MRLSVSRAWRSAAFSGRLGLLLDVDEHTGQFGGARRFFDAMPTARPDGVMIGYPGFDRIIVGSRGFLRARVVVSGVAAHSGGTRQRGVNAVVRAARLVGELEESGFGIGATSSEFDHMPQLTVTAMRGGGSFSQIPDRCEIDLDLRLTHDREVIARDFMDFQLAVDQLAPSKRLVRRAKRLLGRAE